MLLIILILRKSILHLLKHVLGLNILFGILPQEQIEEIDPRNIPELLEEKRNSTKVMP
jgi:hypothetical protein